jgi:hypothetical protein
MTLHRDRTAAVLGVLGVAGNVLGVTALAEVPAAYRPASLDVWAAQAAQHPGATSASAVPSRSAFSPWRAGPGGWPLGSVAAAATPGSRR